ADLRSDRPAAAERSSRGGRVRPRRRAESRAASAPLSFRLAAARLADPDDVVDADEDVHDAETGDEAAHERIVGVRGDGERLLEQRVHRPDARQGNDGEEEARLEAVEREKEGERHARAIVLEREKGGRTYSPPTLARCVQGGRTTSPPSFYWSCFTLPPSSCERCGGGEAGCGCGGGAERVLLPPLSP